MNVLDVMVSIPVWLVVVLSTAAGLGIGAASALIWKIKHDDFWNQPIDDDDDDDVDPPVDPVVPDEPFTRERRHRRTPISHN